MNTNGQSVSESGVAALGSHPAPCTISAQPVALIFVKFASIRAIRVNLFRFLSGYVCVHLWWNRIVPAERA